MSHLAQILCSVAATGLLPAGLEAPAPKPQMSYGENTRAVRGINPPIPTATSFPVSLYGSPALLGEVTRPAPVSCGDFSELLSKDLQTPVSAFDNLPKDQLYIFNGSPAPANISAQNITDPAGILPYDQSYSYNFSRQEPYVIPDGFVKIIDSTTFPIAISFAAALVTVQPGAMREMHWHLESDESNFFIQGSARVTVIAAPSSSRTFDSTAGDCG